jgi:hypothetical protein
MLLIKLKSVSFLLLAAFALSCSKGGSNPNPPAPPAEENLLIGIDPDYGAETAKTLGSSYDFKVLIKSKMPEKGVEGTVTFRKEFDNSLISTQNISGTSSPINVTISNIVLNEVGTVTIELKSKSKPINTASKTFKLARK